MKVETILFQQIDNAVLDIQAAELQTYERPLKQLARLLRRTDLEQVNQSLTRDVDLDAFLAASERTAAGMFGSAHLAWPDDPYQVLGLSLLLILKCADEKDYAANVGHTFFHSGSKLIAGVHALTGQMIVPFARDYKAYVLQHAKAHGSLDATASNKVFIVHGHDEGALQGLARFLEKLGLEAIILREKADQGRTIIEKFEQTAEDIGFAVVLLTPYDLGGSVRAPDHEARARQNVVFELGFFAGKLGRGRVCLLRKGEIEIPSDLFGVIYTEMDANEGWKAKLVRELKAAKLQFDADVLWR